MLLWPSLALRLLLYLFFELLFFILNLFEHLFNLLPTLRPDYIGYISPKLLGDRLWRFWVERHILMYSSRLLMPFLSFLTFLLSFLIFFIKLRFRSIRELEFYLFPWWWLSRFFCWFYDYGCRRIRLLFIKVSIFRWLWKDRSEMHCLATWIEIPTGPIDVLTFKELSLP